jgi:HSP20 family protein
MPFWEERKKKKSKKLVEDAEEPDLRNEFPGFNDDFGDFEKVQEMMDEMMKRAFSGKGLRLTFPQMRPGKPMMYGFSIKMDQTGKPKIQEFGNIEPGKQPTVKRAREPIVDVIEKDKIITVLAELPGVEKKEIKLDVAETKDVLIIEVPNKFYKEAKLPVTVKPKSAKAHYKNGVLEVNLDKEKAGKPKPKTSGSIAVE